MLSAKNNVQIILPGKVAICCGLTPFKRFVLTYMSIEQEIKARKADGSLTVLEPLMPGAPQPRVVLVTKWLLDQMTPPWEDVDDEKRMARLWADLDRFTTGAEIVVGSKSDDKCQMKPLTPHDAEVWSI